MRRIWFLAKQELKQMLRGKIHLGLIVSIWGMIAIAGWIGGVRVTELRKTHTGVSALERRAWEEQPDRHPHRAAHFGQFAFRGPGVLEVIESGVLPFTGSAIYIEPHVRNEPVLPPALSLPPPTRLGYFQINTLFNLFIPLLLIFLVVPRLPFERSAGILRILESQGISARELLLGKALGTWLATLAAFILPFSLIGAGILLGWDPGSLPHFGIYIIQTSLYFLCWSAVLVTLSSYFRTEQAAIGAALGGFILQAMLIPKVVPTLAETLLPEMGTGEFRQRLYSELAKSPNGHRPGGAEFETFKQELLKKNGVATVEELPFNYEGLIMQKAEEHSTTVFRNAFEYQWGLFGRQEALALALSALSPTGIQRVLAMHFSRSHSMHQKDFETQVEDHRSRINRDLNDLLTRLPYQERKTKKLAAVTWSGIPNFSFSPMGVGETLRNAGPALLILTLQTLAAFLVLFRRKELNP
jgi:ABC-2 type transport system permease protein